jgi:DNA-binding NtrC family response regulator
MAINILIIEDDKSIRRVIKKILEGENKNYKIIEAIDGKDGLIKINENQLNLILCDIKMPRLDGIDVLKYVKKNNLFIPFILLTGHGNIDTAVNAMKIGAFDFIEKPPDLNRLLISIRNALKNKKLSDQNTILKSRVNNDYQMIGSSKIMKKIDNLITKVSKTNAKVLITGLNGTGKEIVANQLHQRSNRSKNLMIKVNCAAIPNELIESELFGHIKGSFTSAIKDRKGKFELANNGTLFLDEIGDLSLNAQAKVLRALQENKIVKVGSDKELKTNVRIIAATNKDLEKEINAGTFREDLYHRLAVIKIHLPSLNDRKADIPELTKHFIFEISKDQGVKPKDITLKAQRMLQEYTWKGNVRELRNTIERLLILGDNPINIKNIESFI